MDLIQVLQTDPAHRNGGTAGYWRWQGRRWWAAQRSAPGTGGMPGAGDVPGWGQMARREAAR